MNRHLTLKQYAVRSSSTAIMVPEKKKKKREREKKKTMTWLTSLQSERRALQLRCQPIPTLQGADKEENQNNFVRGEKEDAYMKAGGGRVPSRSVSAGTFLHCTTPGTTRVS